MVDRAALEMRCTGNCTQGSNPCLSARDDPSKQKVRIEFAPFAFFYFTYFLPAELRTPLPWRRLTAFHSIARIVEESGFALVAETCWHRSLLCGSGSQTDQTI